MTVSDVEVSGGAFRVRVASFGGGPPLLYLHGFDGFPGEAPYLMHLAQTHTVILPEHPGFGQSTGIEQIDDILDITLYYRTLIETLGHDRVDVVGHSLGGMFAAELAAICPQVVDHLVLVAPFGLWLDATPIPDLFYLGPAQLQRATWHDPEGEAAQKAMSQLAGVDQTSALEAIITRSGNLSAAGKFLWPIPDRGLSKRLPLISAPTLVVVGESDKLITRPYGEAFAKSIPTASLAVIANAGHTPMAEQPDDFFRHVDPFLNHAASE
ncbi:MAG TPA: alpha/beta hydrolase [Tepidiformaceae bacterium]|nr:alpha/beta hydrolase [Tepidiformaceae bacterium]